MGLCDKKNFNQPFFATEESNFSGMLEVFERIYSCFFISVEN
jgi:hypothetical protein